MKQLYYILFASLVLLLSACSSPPQKQPAGFEVGEEVPQGEQILPSSRTSKTVLALLDNARQAAKDRKSVV